MEFLTQNTQAIVLGAILLAVLLIAVSVWRAFSPRMSGRRGQRLGLTEYYELDKTRRLVLIRRDNVEHLILIGGGQDIVIEPNIPAGPAGSTYVSPASYVSPAPVVHAEQPPAGTARPAPRAPTFSERKAPPPLRPVADAPAPLRPRDDTAP